MKSERVRYFVEGECEKKLIDALKTASFFPPGKVTVFNALTKVFSNSRLMDFSTGSIVILVFDTDGEQDISILNRNIGLLKKHVANVRVFNLISVRNFEDELIRSTQINRIEELTNCRSRNDFKSSFLHLRDCLSILDKHGFDLEKMWRTKPDGPFSVLSQGIDDIKKWISLRC